MLKLLHSEPGSDPVEHITSVPPNPRNQSHNLFLALVARAMSVLDPGKLVFLKFVLLYIRVFTKQLNSPRDALLTEIHAAAKETVALAEARYLSKQDEWQFDTAWQEMLNHATKKVAYTLIVLHMSQ